MPNLSRGKVFFEKWGKVEYYNSEFLVNCMYTSPLISQTLSRGKGFFGKLGRIKGYNSVFLIYCINVQNLPGGRFFWKIEEKV